MDTAEIANLLNVSQKTVWYFMVKNGIPRRNKKQTGASDLIGKQIGELFVIRRAEEVETNQGTMWECKCSCGNTKIIRGSSLTTKNATSCGCKWRRASYEEISGSYWWGLKRNAQKRKFAFEVTQQEMWELFLKQNRQCALSDAEIGFGKGLNRNGQTASLDRIDSSKGYVIGNVRWVHKTVNQMKWDLSDESFFQWVHRVAMKYDIGR